VGTKGELADPFVTHVTNGGWVYSAGWTRILSPRTLSDFRVVFSNRWFDRTSNGRDSRIWLQNWSAKLGLKNLDPEAFPAFSLAGYTA